MKYTIELSDTTNTLLNELTFKETTQKSVSLTYAFAMLSSEKTDWFKVNQAIIERWSVAGLQRVKTLAHRHAKDITGGGK
jgi:hypothetical protein